MKTRKSIYQIVVDKSGSMSDCIDKTIEGFNGQIRKLQELTGQYPEEEITVGLTLFDTRVVCPYHAKDPRQAAPLDTETYEPGGCTALLDAIGLTIEKLEGAKKESTVPATVVMIIITDGHENASQTYTLEAIRSRIEALQATGEWTFSFIGATLDAVDVASDMSIPRHNSFSFEKNGMREEVWNRVYESSDYYMEKKRMRRKLDNLYEKPSPDSE